MSLGEKIRRASGPGYVPGAFHILTLIVSAAGAVILALSLHVLTTIENKADQQSQKLDVLNQAIAIVGGRISTIEANGATRDKRLDDHAAKLAAHDYEINDLDKRYSELAVHVNDDERKRR